MSGDSIHAEGVLLHFHRPPETRKVLSLQFGRPIPDDAATSPRISEKLDTSLAHGQKRFSPLATCTCLQVVLGHFSQAK